MRRLWTVLILAVATVSSVVPVRPYTPQYTDPGSKIRIRWAGNSINVSLSSSLSSPQSNIKSGSDVIGAARRALAKWSAVADIQFNESTSEIQSISAAGTSGDGVTLITVAATPENVAPFLSSTDDMSGRTRLFFTRTGRITEADIVLNPYQQFSTDGTPGTYDLEASFLHEIGHLLGLEHSSSVGATMQPRQGRNGLYSLPAWTTRTLSEDDRAGARALYGERADEAKRRGSVTGTITSPSGAPIFGANVWVEEATTGRVFGSNITLVNGTYRLDGLAVGSYRLFVEALDGLINITEVAGSRGAYGGLAALQNQSFRTEELGLVRVTSDHTSVLNGEVSDKAPSINPTFIGFNGQLSTLAVPLSRGRIYTIYVGGDGFTSKQLMDAVITVSSPWINVVPSSVTLQQFGGGVSVFSFDVAVGNETPVGEYSIRISASSGEVACVVGGLTIDDPGTPINPWQSQTLTP